MTTTLPPELGHVPRALFVPDLIWVQQPPHSGRFEPVSKHRDRARWDAVVAADEPVITQLNMGAVPEGGDPVQDGFPTSSASMPSVVARMLAALDPAPGMRVLEIGTGTGWNAALLARRVGAAGRVTTIEIDPGVAEHARRALTAAGYPACSPLVVVGDGAAEHVSSGPFDRVISTAAVRETVPPAWLAALRPGGRLVTPWSTDFSAGQGVLLTVDRDPDGPGARGRFAGPLAFMRLRQQLNSRYAWEPGPDLLNRVLAEADISATDCRGGDLDRILNPTKGDFAIGARLANVARWVGWHTLGERHHVIELTDPATHSLAQVDADLTDPAPFVVRQYGPRRLWDETEAAYRWWHEVGEPRLGSPRFGLTLTHTSQTLWLDTPATLVRHWELDAYASDAASSPPRR
jgi:protein-L-isoaspartate O-methyltransferase